MVKITLKNPDSDTVIYCPSEDLSWWVDQLYDMPARFEYLTFDLVQ